MSARAGGNVGLVEADALERLNGVVQRLDAHEAQAVSGADRFGAVVCRREEDRRALVSRSDQLLLDAADRTDLAVGAISPVPAMSSPPVSSSGVSLS